MTAIQSHIYETSEVILDAINSNPKKVKKSTDQDYLKDLYLNTIAISHPVNSRARSAISRRQSNFKSRKE